MALILLAVYLEHVQMSEELKAALARITCLEGEIAKRDARIMGLESQYQRDVWGLNNEGDPIGGEPAGGYANDNARLRAELAAIKAQEPVQVDYVAVMRANGDGGLEVEWLLEGGTAELMNGMYLCCVGGGTLLFEEGSGQLYAAPVSEAKAQGVVMPERWNVPRPMWMDARQPYGNPLNHADIEAAEKFNLALDEVARLNAVPVQKASIPDDFVCDSKPLQELLNATAMLLETPCPDSATYWAAQLANVEQLLADPAAPAADAWIPVSERLPAVESRLDQECRAGTLSIAPLNVSAAVLVFDGEKVRSKRLDWFDGCLPLPYCITHWMPLPAAPAAHSAKGVV